MRRPALLAPLLATALLLGACGGGDDGGGGGEPSATPRPAPAVPAGFAATQGDAWFFARPAGFEPVAVTVPAGREFVTYQRDPADPDGIPSQIALGTGPSKGRDLQRAATVIRETAKAKYPGYAITSQGAFDLQGATAYSIDATYDSFEAEPKPVRTVNLVVRTSRGTQMNLSVRGPQADFERLGLDTVLSTFRIR